MSQKLLTTLIFLSLVGIVFIPRLTNLDRFITTDEPRWQANVTGFVTKLSAGQFQSFLQQPHPGLTQQWFAAPTVFADNWALRKTPLALWHGILVLLIGYVFWRLHGKNTGLLTILLLGINPFLIAHSRVYAMDALLAEFILLSLSLLLLWHKNHTLRYLFFSGAAAAAAFWSKQSGLITVLFSFLFIIMPAVIASRVANTRHSVAISSTKSLSIFVAGLTLTSILIQPALIINPQDVYGDLTEFYRSDEYSEVHQYGHTYYLATLLFFSTPLHLLALLILVFTYQNLSPEKRRTIKTLLLFSLLFTLAMSLGAKKGYRYILPVFPILDIITAIAILPLFKKEQEGIKKLNKSENTSPQMSLSSSNVILSTLASALILLQAIHLTSLHPYELSYINPLTKPVFNQRQLGWGEGLDLAADYLNQKSTAKQLKVAAYYNTQFKPFFHGETIPLHQWDEGSPDYTILYRSMLGRSEKAWETDVLNQFKNKTPEIIITLNNLEYLWIYKMK